MNMLKTIESTIAGVLEGAFGRVFRSEVRPVELARKLAREMDEHRTESLSRVYAPNEFSVWLSPRDRARYEGVEHEVIDELCAYLLEHARREGLILASPPHISFHTDERLELGEFGIQAQLVRDDAGSSRRHAEIRPGVGGWTIADLGSTNGVLLNGRPLGSRHALHPGDRIELGSTEIVFEIR